MFLTYLSDVLSVPQYRRSNCPGALVTLPGRFFFKAWLKHAPPWLEGASHRHDAKEKRLRSVARLFGAAGLCILRTACEQTSRIFPVFVRF